MTGVFNSCRDLQERLCESLVAIWKERKANPLLLQQPSKQWADIPKKCNFDGYETDAQPLNMDILIGNPIFLHRMLAASVDDANRMFWANSRLEE